MLYGPPVPEHLWSTVYPNGGANADYPNDVSLNGAVDPIDTPNELYQMVHNYEEAVGTSPVDRTLPTDFVGTDFTNNSMMNVLPPNLFPDFDLNSGLNFNNIISGALSLDGLENYGSVNSARTEFLQGLYSKQIDFEYNKKMAEISNQYNVNSAKTAMDYQDSFFDKYLQAQRELRSTAMQDTIKDYKDGGINPILAYSNGANQATGTYSGQGHSSVTSAGFTGGGNVASSYAFDYSNATEILKTSINSATTVAGKFLNGITKVASIAGNLAGLATGNPRALLKR